MVHPTRNSLGVERRTVALRHLKVSRASAPTVALATYGAIACSMLSIIPQVVGSIPTSETRALLA